MKNLIYVLINVDTLDQIQQARMSPERAEQNNNMLRDERDDDGSEYRWVPLAVFDIEA